MNITQLPIYILDKIFDGLYDTQSYANCRLTCKSFYYLISTVKRYYRNKKIKEIYCINNGILNGHNIRWYINGKVRTICNYINSKKDKEEIEYYLHGNVKSITNYVLGLKSGEYNEFYDNPKQIKKKCYYKYGEKFGKEVIYDIDGIYEFVIKYISSNKYIITYYKNNTIIHSHFENNLLHGEQTIEYEKYKHSLYTPYNKLVKRYNKCDLVEIKKYDNNILLEKYDIKNGFKNDWSLKWFDNNCLREISQYRNNKLNGTLCLYHKNYSRKEYFEYKDNYLHGDYKIISSYLNKIIPFKNNIIDGNVIEKYNITDNSYSIQFKNGLFNNRFIKIKKNIKEEFLIFRNLFIYTKYIDNRKLLRLKFLNNSINIYVFDLNDTVLINYDLNLKPYLNITYNSIYV